MKISKKRSLRACTDNEDQFARGKKKGTMTREELLALPLRKLDAMLAKKVMGWTNLGNHYSKEHPSGREPGTSNYRIVPHYSSDDNAVRLVRNRIAKLGLKCEWLIFLRGSLLTPSPDEAFDEIANAPANEQCVAAILAVQKKERGE